jgi:hypothetical protein
MNESHKIVKPVHELLQRDVNRYEFLSIVGFGILGLVGLGPLIHFLTGRSTKLAGGHLTNYTTTGYGNSRYGV